MVHEGLLFTGRFMRQQPVHHRHEYQRGEGGKQQAADHGARQRRILFAALADAEGHWNHADDHRPRRHQHGAQAGIARCFRRNP